MIETWGSCEAMMNKEFRILQNFAAVYSSQMESWPSVHKRGAKA
jgi:hypothetical protein